MAFDIPAAEPTPEEIAKECSEAAENAVEWIRSMSGIELDYSPPSLLVLDRVLDELMGNLGKDDREPTTVLLGSYLGEVILRACGGRWETGDGFTGPGLRGLCGCEITVNPFARIQQAFDEHEPHHCAVYWNNVVEKIRKADRLDDPSGFSAPPGKPVKKLNVSGGHAKPEAGPSDEELSKTIAEETAKFIDLLHDDLGIELDYSLNSLNFLDHYLRSLSDKMKDESEMKDVRVFVYLAGNYLGEVIRRAYGGRWVYVPDQQTSGLIIKEQSKEGTIYPHKAAANLAMEYQSGGVLAYAENVRKKLMVG